MKNEVIIRNLSANDAAFYQKLRLEALQQHPEAFAASFEDEKAKPLSHFESRLDEENAITIGAFDTLELVGSVTLFREAKQKMNHKAFIFAMFVKENQRGKGIAKQLIGQALQHARNWTGVEQVYLTVMAENEPAKKLYASFGFEEYGLERKALKVDERYYDEYHMVLFL